MAKAFTKNSNILSHDQLHFLNLLQKYSKNQQQMPKQSRLKKTVTNFYKLRSCLECELLGLLFY